MSTPRAMGRASRGVRRRLGLGQVASAPEPIAKQRASEQGNAGVHEYPRMSLEGRPKRPVRMPYRAVWRMLEVAACLGVSHQRVTQMYAEGKLLEPKRVDSIGPLWKPATIERWAEREWWGTRRWRRKAYRRSEGKRT